MDREALIPRWINFVFGGLSGVCAASVVHPADLVKTRMQLLPPKVTLSTYAVVKRIILKEGVRGFYSGFSASVCRQTTYTAGRLGCFITVLDWYKSKYGKPSFSEKLCIASLSGAVGAVLGNPAEVALTRMTADGYMHRDKKRNYKNVFDALVRITREESVLTLFRGAGATITRSMVVNASQLGVYAQAREKLLPIYGEGIKLHLVASMISGFATTCVYLPADIVKTRVQNALESKSQMGVLMTVIRNEGTRKLWSGFLATYMKLGPQTVLLFLFLEQLNALYLKIG
ncbi:mitochondrial 2-oxoglutarate/malate carrier protein-like [Battus philenor]|uniref:mitochondrial 2-oxoglutarate/malate carrier protein-like n=1 Tax=Battus philenor TaxID=42288 RepID=UPI0035D038D4